MAEKGVGDGGRGIWLTEGEAAAWRGYRLISQLVDAAVGSDLRRDSALSWADYHVLSTLGETPEGVEWRLGTLADRLLWTRSRLAHQLRRMESRDLIARPSRPGAAGPAVELTDAGWKTLLAAAPLHVASARKRLLDLLDETQQAQLVEIADAVVKGLREAKVPSVASIVSD